MKPDRRWWFSPRVTAGYAVAVESVAAAVSGSLWLDIYAVGAPVSLFLCSIMLTAWLGGFGPGLLATTLSILAFKCYYAAPLHTFAVDVKEIPRIFVSRCRRFLPGCLVQPKDARRRH